LPIKIIQSNQRIAEAQFICDTCGKIVKTSLVPKEELDAQYKKEVICYQCKLAKRKNSK
jgi:hypothetical protein